MSFTLTLNSSNVVGANNNTYQYQFISGGFHAKDMELAVGALTMPYAWYNVTQAYNNNTILIGFPSATGTYVLSIVLPDGFYLVSDINQYIELQCYNLGLYLINSSSGLPTYFFQVFSNTTYYSNQILLSLVPSSSNYVAQGYSLPPSGVWSSTGAGLAGGVSTPGFQLPTTGSISTILGFATGVYLNSTTASQSLTSTLTPVGSTVNALVLRCNLVSNNVAVPSDVLDLVPINSTFGSNITYTPFYPKWLSLRDGIYNTAIFTFNDQNFNTLISKDPHIALTIIIRKKQNIDDYKK